jgi:hypothetical protein
MKLKQQKLFKQLAIDILQELECKCNEYGAPEQCECGGDGTDDFMGCWACQAFTALYGFGKVPK